jgi:acyl carrier protein
MESKEIYNRLAGVFQEVFDDDQIVVRPDLTAAEVEEWDSLKHIRLVLSVEREFHISFAASEIGNLKNVGDLANLIQAKA